MKIAFIEWASFGKEDIIQALTSLSHSVVRFSHPDYDLRESTDFTRSFSDFVKEQKPELVFSSNYFPLVSSVCNTFEIPYISWVYDCPHLSLFSATVINPCNHIFVFDRDTVNYFKSAGITTIEYMPLAAAVRRLDSMEVTPAIKDKLGCDVSFVGAMYNEAHNLFDRLWGLSDYAQGYLNGIMRSQLKISGYNFIEELLNDNVMAELRSLQPYVPEPDGAEPDSYVYSRFFIDRKLTQMERADLLGAVSEHFDTYLYTHNRTPELPYINNIGPIDPVTTMPYVFKCSKINLNITLRSIHTGIPLRAMDIMGAGGFLLTNYQSDMDEFFTAGQDYVWYDGKDDLLSKCEYFLTHEKDRTEIAHNGHAAISSAHTYEIRLQQMLESVF